MFVLTEDNKAINMDKVTSMSISGNFSNNEYDIRVAFENNKIDVPIYRCSSMEEAKEKFKDIVEQANGTKPVFDEQSKSDKAMEKLGELDIDKIAKEVVDDLSN